MIDLLVLFDKRSQKGKTQQLWQVTKQHDLYNAGAGQLQIVHNVVS